MDKVFKHGTTFTSRDREGAVHQGEAPWKSAPRIFAGTTNCCRTKPCLETNPEDLVDVARQCFEEEVARRGLDVGADTPVGGDDARPQSHDAEEVLIATFTSGDELNLARGLLQSASIPSRVENPLALVAGMELRLIVPAEFEEQALEVLGAEISEDELAAQAEAAGEFEEREGEEKEGEGLEDPAV